jgi:hypothetical protein
MNVNLVEFFSVQMASGLDSEIFLSFEEAQEAARVHDEAVWAEFEASGRGATSYLESDLEGGCVQVVTVHDVYLSGAIYTHPKWTANASMWFDHPDFHKVRWGNPALEREMVGAKKFA